MRYYREGGKQFGKRRLFVMRRNADILNSPVYRAPRAGEWYLSGAVPEAYQAPTTLSASYYILTEVPERRQGEDRRKA